MSFYSNLYLITLMLEGKSHILFLHSIPKMGIQIVCLLNLLESVKCSVQVNL